MCSTGDHYTPFGLAEEKEWHLPQMYTFSYFCLKKYISFYLPLSLSKNNQKTTQTKNHKPQKNPQPSASLPPSKCTFCLFHFLPLCLKVYNFSLPTTLTSCCDCHLFSDFFPSKFSPLRPLVRCDSSQIGISSVVPDASTTHNNALVLTCTIQEEGSWKTSK